MSDDTKPNDSQPPEDPFRTTVVVAEGPNKHGHGDLARLAHTLPDPAVVDDPEHPDAVQSAAPPTEG